MDLDRLIGIFGLLFVGAIVGRIYLVYRQNGYLPIVFGRSDSAHDYVHKVLMAIVVLETVNIVVFRFQALGSYLGNEFLASLYAYLLPIHALEIPTVKICGLVIAFAGLIWSMASQSQMGKDWRVGIDDKNETSLVTRGLYTISRHPIYLGFMAVTSGIFLATPNAVSLACAVLSVAVLGVQARLEEEFLLARHGEVYRDYLAATRRWV